MVIQVKTNLPQFNRRNNQLARRSVKGAGNSTKQAARFLRRNARMLAPRKTGKLINSILLRKTKKGHTVLVTAKSNKGFPYPKWVNQDAGFVNLNYPNGANFTSESGHHIFISPGERLTYGSSPADWNWTGRPRFFRTAIQRTRKRFKFIAQREMNKALKVNIS